MKPPHVQKPHKPLLYHSLSIWSLYTYREFLKKGPKKVSHLKFSAPSTLSLFEEKQVKVQLLNALSLLRHLQKVDLKQLKTSDSYYWNTRLLLTLKRNNSHVKTLLLPRQSRNCKERHFRHLGRLRHLDYRLQDWSPDWSKKTLPLKYLEYCSKIHSLKFVHYNEDCFFSDTFPSFRPYLKLLEGLVLHINLWNQKELNFSFEVFKHLKSVSFKFPQIPANQQFLEILMASQSLPHLQEMTLYLTKYIALDFIEPFQQITQRGMLKKVGLNFGEDTALSFTKTLEALKNCYNLSHFSLNINLKGDELLKPIAEFIKGMSQLEYLQISLINENLFSTNSDCGEICKQIGSLQRLRSLKLRFKTKRSLYPSCILSNFIPHLSGLFTKTIKIETFELECNQIYFAEALQDLIQTFGNSASFLRNLKIDFNNAFYIPKIHQLILNLLQNLSDIRTLEINCLDVNDSKSLKDIAKTICSLKYLTEFFMGEIKGRVFTSEFCDAVTAISSKKGLRQFGCLLSQHFDQRFGSGTRARNGLLFDIERIIQKNPDLQNLSLNSDFDTAVSFQIHKWSVN